MKQVFSFLALTISLLVISCEECGECFTPPTPFTFELVDQQGDNIFTTGQFNQDQLCIKLSSSNQTIEYRFIAESDQNLIEIGAIGWTSEQVELSFQLDDVEVFKFYVNAERRSEDCCTFTSYSDIKIEGANFELESQTGNYKVTVE